MAHAIRGGEQNREPLILAKALLFWAAFAVLGIAGFYGIDRVVDPSADFANLTLPSDGQLEGAWVSGPLRLQNRLTGRGMSVELWRSAPHAEQIAGFELERGAKQGPIGFRHSFVGGADGAVAMRLDGQVLTLQLPAIRGWPAGPLSFRRL